MSKSILLPATSLAVLLFAAAGCQTTAPDRFTEADANRDGKLSFEEGNTYHLTKLFESRDANHDGKLTREEWVVGGDKAQEKALQERDADRDGAVTLAEATAYGQKKGEGRDRLKEADTDKDGLLSREEATAYWAKREGPVN